MDNETRRRDDINRQAFVGLFKRFLHRLHDLPACSFYHCMEMFRKAHESNCDIYIEKDGDKYYLSYLLTGAIFPKLVDTAETDWSIQSDSGEFSTEHVSMIEQLVRDADRDYDIAYRWKHPLSVYLIGSRTCDYRRDIYAELSTRYKGQLSVFCRQDDEVSFADFAEYARADIVVFNWNKYAYMFRLFLHKNPAFNAQTVLYSGAPACFETYVAAAISGVFNYVILFRKSQRESNMFASDYWFKVLRAVYAGKTNKIEPFDPTAYLRYKWGRVRFARTEFQRRVDNAGYPYWGAMPKHEFERGYENQLRHVIEQQWIREIRQESVGPKEAWQVSQ